MWLLWSCVPEQVVLSFSDTNNFQFSSEITSLPTSMKAQEDLIVDWSGLDYRSRRRSQGHAVSTDTELMEDELRRQ